eukprot:jgi/Mesvir1/16667/Mv15069-RA.2
MAWPELWQFQPGALDACFDQGGGVREVVLLPLSGNCLLERYGHVCGHVCGHAPTCVLLGCASLVSCRHGCRPYAWRQDLIDRGDLKLDELHFRVLDEADEMLSMGFVEDIEYILGAQKDSSKVQTMLFSATLPGWVAEIAKRFLKEPVTVDLVREHKMKASNAVRHLMLPCHWTQRAQVITDVVRCYNSGNGRTIIFSETKNDANELCQGLTHMKARALHGDIPQAQREATLAAFRSGEFTVLVATDVAARGLDIQNVTLVVQSEPPQSVETYIHRSGRTGRAGHRGVAVTLVTQRREYMVAQIERHAGVKFERVGAPQPSDIAKASATNAMQAIVDVSDSVIPLFRGTAEKMVEGKDALDVLAKALAKIAGHTEIRSRSLLTAREDATTLLATSTVALRTPSYVFSYLRRILPEGNLEEVRRMTLLEDSMGAVFDVPQALAQEFVQASKEDAATGMPTMSLSIPTELPKLQVRVDDGASTPRGGWGGGRGGFTRGRDSPGGRRGGFGGGGGGGEGRPRWSGRGWRIWRSAWGGPRRGQASVTDLPVYLPVWCSYHGHAVPESNRGPYIYA